MFPFNSYRKPNIDLSLEEIIALAGYLNKDIQYDVNVLNLAIHKIKLVALRRKQSLAKCNHIITKGRHKGEKYCEVYKGCKECCKLK